MNRAHQPAKLHFGHEELDRFEGFAGAGAIIEQQQDTCADLNTEQEQRHAAEIIPKGVTVQRYLFLFGELGKIAQADPLIEPEPKFAVLWAFCCHAFLSPSY